MARKVKLEQREANIMTCGCKSIKLQVLLPIEDRRLKAFSVGDWRVKYILETLQGMPELRTWKMAHAGMPIELNIVYGTPPMFLYTQWERFATQYGLVAPLDARYREIKTIVENCIDGLAGTLYERPEQVFKYSVERKYTKTQEYIEIDVVAYYTDVGDIKAEVKKRKLEDKLKKEK